MQVRQFAYAPIECNYMVVDGDGAVYVSIAKPEFIDGLQEWTSETRLYLIGQTIGPPDPDWDTKIHEFEKSTKI